MEENPVICTCLDLTKNDILKAIKEKGCKTVEELTEAIEAGAVCGSCIDDLQELVDEVNG